MSAEARTAAVIALAFLFGAFLAAVAAARPDVELPVCECGCPAKAHEHVRPGTWCRYCRSWRTAEPCDRYEPARQAAAVDAEAEATATLFLRRVGELLLEPDPQRDYALVT